MTSGGDAAEQIVRLSLEGIEVAAKISGEGAKNIAVILMAVLKEEHKTKGKARLSSMIRSGKELKVFSIQNKDLATFAREAKRYGVLYCVLKDRENRSDHAAADIIARAEDAAKIQRIVDRFDLAKVDRAAVTGELKKDREDVLLDEVLTQNSGKEQRSLNPYAAKTEKSPPSERNSKGADRSAEDSIKSAEKPSVRKKLDHYRNDMKTAKGKRKEPFEKQRVSSAAKGKER